MGYHNSSLVAQQQQQQGDKVSKLICGITLL